MKASSHSHSSIIRLQDSQTESDSAEKHNTSDTAMPRAISMTVKINRLSVSFSIILSLYRSPIIREMKLASERCPARSDKDLL